MKNKRTRLYALVNTTPFIVGGFGWTISIPFELLIIIGCIWLIMFGWTLREYWPDITNLFRKKQWWAIAYFQEGNPNPLELQNSLRNVLNQIDAKPAGRGRRKGILPPNTIIYEDNNGYIGLSLPIPKTIISGGKPEVDCDLSPGKSATGSTKKQLKES